MRFDRSRGGRGGYGGRGGRFRDRRPGYRLPKPVKVGEEYDVEIKEVGSRGDGIARIKNFVIFVTGAKMGDKIKVKITDVRGRFATAEKVGEAEAVPAEGTEEGAAAEESAAAEEGAEAEQSVEGETMEEEKEMEDEEEAVEEAPAEEDAPAEAAEEEPAEEEPAEEAAEEEDASEE